MILTFRRVGNRFFIENLKYKNTAHFFKEVFTDTLCVERYAGPRLDCRIWIAKNDL